MVGLRNCQINYEILISRFTLCILYHSLFVIGLIWLFKKYKFFVQVNKCSHIIGPWFSSMDLHTCIIICSCELYSLFILFSPQRLILYLSVSAFLSSTAYIMVSNSHVHSMQYQCTSLLNDTRTCTYR